MRRQCCIAGRRRPAQRMVSARCGGLGEFDSEEPTAWPSIPPACSCVRGAARRCCFAVAATAASATAVAPARARRVKTRAARPRGVTSAAVPGGLRTPHGPGDGRRRQSAQPGRDNASSANFVTHQGSPLTDADAPLPPCEQAAQPKPAAEPKPADTVTDVALICRRCAAALSPWARQGFLRHARGARWAARVVEPSP